MLKEQFNIFGNSIIPFLKDKYGAFHLSQRLEDRGENNTFYLRHLIRKGNTLFVGAKLS